MGKNSKKVYAVCRGHKTGIFQTWDQCSLQVHGFKGAVFKSFSSTDEAQLYLSAFNSTHSLSSSSSFLPPIPSHPIKTIDKSHAMQSSSENAPSPPPYSERPLSVDSPPPPYSLPSTSTPSLTVVVKDQCWISEDSVIVYTDGSCLNNGKPSATAGYGAFYGEGDSRNIAKRLNDPRQTNQRAELRAVLEVLTSVDAALTKSLEIRTDSKYTINASTDWIISWHAKKEKDRKPYTNLDIMTAIYDTMNELRESGTIITFTYVSAHTGEPGNEAADQLAKLGALKPLDD